MFIKKKDDSIKIIKAEDGKNSIIVNAVLERGCDIPDSFVRYVNYDVILLCLLNKDVTVDMAKKLIDKTYPKLLERHQYMLISTVLLTFEKHQFSHLFPQQMLSDVIKHSKKYQDIFGIVRDIVSNEIYIEPCLIYALLVKYVGKFWFLRRWGFIYDTLMTLLYEHVEMDDGAYEYVLPSVYELISSRITEKNNNVTRIDLYKSGTKAFIHNGATIEEIYTYMNYYIENNCTHILPMSLVVSLISFDVDEGKRIITEKDRFAIYRTKQLIRRSVSLNANNAYMIYWAKESINKQLLEDISESIVPINRLDKFMDTFKLGEKISDSIVVKLIHNGVKVSDIVPYMSDLTKFTDDIFSFDVFNKFVFKNDVTDITNIEESSSNEYLLDILSIDEDIVLNNSTLPFMDYIIQHNIIQDRLLLLTVEHAILTNRELFMKLKTESISIIMDGKDKSIYKLYPATITRTVYESLTQSEINKMILENPDVAKYIPSRYIDIQTLISSMKINMRDFIPIYHTITEPISSGFILSLILDYDCGYGYIADVETSVQRDAIIHAIIENKQETKSVY